VWIDRESEGPAGSFVPLIRPGAGKRIRVYLTGEPARVYVHYFNRRSLPCVGPGCGLCKLGTSRRLYTYWPCVSESGTPAILELTALTEAMLLEQMHQVTHEPRGRVDAYRPPGKNNNPVEVNWEDRPSPASKTGRPLDLSDVREALCKLWQIPVETDELQNGEYNKALVASILSKIAALTKTKS
jgi:hypothetical protein